MDERELAGRRVRVYKGGFPHLRAIFEHAKRWAEREYLIFEGERLTYGAHIARSLHWPSSSRRIRWVRCKGDRIAIAARNFPEWSVVFWAGAVAGAV